MIIDDDVESEEILDTTLNPTETEDDASVELELGVDQL